MNAQPAVDLERSREAVGAFSQQNRELNFVHNRINMTQELQEFRCAECRKLLFKAASLQAMIEIKCKGCKQINVIDAMQGMESSRIYLSETVQA